MKKVVSIILTVAMLVTVAFSTFTVTASAQDLTFGQNSIKEVIEFIGNNLPETPTQRKEVFDLLKGYLATNMGIDTLIEVVKDPEGTVPGDIAAIVENIGAANIAAKEAELVFALNFIKAASDEKVAAGFDAFVEEIDFPNPSSYITNQAALTAIYNSIVPASARTKLEASGVTANALLKLVEIYNGEIKFTDNKYGGANIALLSITGLPDAQECFEGISSINGATVSSVNNIITKVLESINNSFTTEEKSNIKAVLGEIGMYTAAKDTQTQNSYDKGPGMVIPEEEEEPEATYEEVTEVMSIPTPEVVETATFADTEEHWSAPYVSQLASRGILAGKGDGKFAPNDGITRQELAVILVRALGLETKVGTVKAPSFKDVVEIADWSRDYVAVVAELGIFKGYDDGSFMPNKVVSREELAAVLIRSLGKEINKAAFGYSDRHEISDWAELYVGKATHLGIVAGYPDGTFKAQNTVTRGEGAKMVYNFLEVQ